MASGDWAQQQKMLSAAGLLVMGLDAKDKIEQLVDINPLIEAARASNVQLLTSQSMLFTLRKQKAGENLVIQHLTQ